VLPFKLLVLLASSTIGDTFIFFPFLKYRSLYKPPTHQDWGQAGTACSRFARDAKEFWHQLENIITKRMAGEIGKT